MIFWRRPLAFLLDYLFVAGYAVLLLLASFGLQQFFGKFSFAPVQGQLVGFITLTLPVFLYFFLSEKSSRHATPGKRIYGLHIIAGPGAALNTRRVFARNFFKLLPWEVAHTGVHWLMYYSGQYGDPPVWVFVVLVVPQLVVLGYLLSVLISGGRSSWYDRMAGTRVAQVL